MANTTRKEEGPDKRVNQQQGSTKLYSRMLSKDVAIAVPSFRVYYGVASAGSGPFLWESQPGTPKSSPSAAALPPLTPPPSYYAAGGKGGSKRGGAGDSERRQGRSPRSRSGGEERSGGATGWMVRVSGVRGSG